MTLKSLTYRPGLSKESTNYANEGAWFAADKVRFRSGFPEKLGGWERYSSNDYLDIARSLENWVSIIGNDYLGIGTNKKYYIEFNGELTNITPLVLPAVVLSANPLTFVSGSAVITVTATAHGMQTGDYCYISGVTPDPIKGIPASEINNDVTDLVDNPGHRVTVLDSNTFTITVTTQATSSGAAGGSAVTLNIEVSAGEPFATIGLGWGTGTWGRGTWGSAASSGVTTALGFWAADNYGQNLVLAPRNGEIYYWDVTTSVSAAGAPSARAVALTTLTAASDCPTQVGNILITEELHLVALGANAIGTTNFNPLLVRWSDGTNPANWTPGISTSAGGVGLAYGSKIVGYVHSRQEQLIFTDTALYSMQYLGPPYYYKITPVSTSISAISPFGAVSVNNITYWMGDGKFFAYSGTVETLPCSLRQYIFNDFNYTQKEQVVCGANPDFNEVWWFYCTSTATYPDRYVIYNYLERIWYYGQLNRTAWTGDTVRQYPIAAQSGALIYQEKGVDDNSTGTPVAISAYIQSADFDVEDGFHYMFVKRLIPDITFSGSTATSPQVTFTLYARDFPGGPYNEETDEPITRSSSVPVEQYTDQVWFRLRGRQVALRVASNQLGVAWQLGIPRLDGQQDGRR